jgi:hypothetical protein
LVVDDDPAVMNGGPAGTGTVVGGRVREELPKSFEGVPVSGLPHEVQKTAPS